MIMNKYSLLTFLGIKVLTPAIKVSAQPLQEKEFCAILFIQLCIKSISLCNTSVEIDFSLLANTSPPNAHN